MIREMPINRTILDPVPKKQSWLAPTSFRTDVSGSKATDANPVPKPQSHEASPGSLQTKLCMYPNTT
jgi:hypothetical protein